MFTDHRTCLETNLRVSFISSVYGLSPILVRLWDCLLHRYWSLILIMYTISRYDQLFVILDSHQINFHQLTYYTHFTVSLILTVYRRTIHSDDPKYLPLCWQRRNECHPGHPSSEVHYITGESTESLAYFSLWLMSRSEVYSVMQKSSLLC